MRPEAGGTETSTLQVSLARLEHRASPPRFLPGERVADRFRILRFLGQGGMAQVYEAEDLEVGQRVAIKALRPRLAHDERALRRFRAEVLLARKVTHPNVCRIFDVFQHGKGLVLSMELLEGETLRDRLRRGPLSPEEALPLVRQMTEALGAAHRADVAHLDFKSANVMLVPSAAGLRAVVTDFGLARSSDVTEGRRPMMGTPAYMAPEQVRGEEATAAADLYALGVVLYEMVTGDLPFQGETPRETARKRLEEPPPRPRARVPSLPLVWDEVVLRCLQPEASLRFGTAGEVADALSSRQTPFAWKRAAAVLLPLALLAAVPINPPPSRSALLYSQGVEALRASEPQKAIDPLIESVRLDPSSALARSALADAWMELGYQTRAREESRKAFERSRGLPRRDRLAVEARYHEHHFRWNAATERYMALWGFYPGDIESGLRLARTQAEARRGNEALETLSRLVDSADPRIDLQEAAIHEARRDVERQFQAATRALGKARRLGQERAIAQACQSLGEARRARGDLERARQDQEFARAVFLRRKDLGEAAESLFWLGVTLDNQKLVLQALSEFQRIGHRTGEAKALRRQAHLAFPSGDRDRIESLLSQSLAIFQEVGDRRGQGRVQADLGEHLRLQGRFAEAREQLEGAIQSLRLAGDRHGEARALLSLGLALRPITLSESTRVLKQALTLCRRIGDVRCQELASS